MVSQVGGYSNHWEAHESCRLVIDVIDMQEGNDFFYSF